MIQDVPSDGIVARDAVLVGAGIMSATVATLLRALDPSMEIEVLERLGRIAGESSDAANNAGTGHAALCELNYTPQGGDGTVDVRKAVKVMEAFEVSRQFWAHLAERPGFAAPGTFIRSVPHASFVEGEDDVRFLRARFEALQGCALFRAMRHSAHAADLAEWMPLVMEGRDVRGPVAATHSALGTDVDFGTLTRAMFALLERSDGFRLRLQHEVESVTRLPDDRWLVEAVDRDGHLRRVSARFVFLGAGGAALTLLSKAGIPEGDGYGGFPVSGQWLVCTDEALALRHAAKVYGKAKVGAPPMSVPHLDTRYIDGRRTLMFGPFAGFSTRFLKAGSYLDLPRSITPDNVVSMLGAGMHNLPLTRYLVAQVTQSLEDRIEALREFVPSADAAQWRLEVAGQRVQVIKKDEDDGGRLEFGTEIISAKDNSLAALLGASPGASTSVSIALDLLEDCFPERMATARWKARLQAMIPSYGVKLATDAALAARVRDRCREVLGLDA